MYRRYEKWVSSIYEDLARALFAVSNRHALFKVLKDDKRVSPEELKHVRRRIERTFSSLRRIVNNPKRQMQLARRDLRIGDRGR
jgi:hypothetical protein